MLLLIIIMIFVVVTIRLLLNSIWVGCLIVVIKFLLWAISLILLSCWGCLEKLIYSCYLCIIVRQATSISDWVPSCQVKELRYRVLIHQMMMLVVLMHSQFSLTPILLGLHQSLSGWRLGYEILLLLRNLRQWTRNGMRLLDHLVMCVVIIHVSWVSDRSLTLLFISWLEGATLLSVMLDGLL